MIRTGKIDEALDLAETEANKNYTVPTVTFEVEILLDGSREAGEDFIKSIEGMDIVEFMSELSCYNTQGHKITVSLDKSVTEYYDAFGMFSEY